MLLDNNVEIRINASNIKRLKKLGYTNIKVTDIIEIKICHLSKGSHVKVKMKCPICGNIFIIEYQSLLKAYPEINNYKCRNCKRKENLNLKYGIDNVFQLDNTKNKIKKTVIDKYGVDNVSKNENIQNKKKETNLKRYGVEWCQSNETIRNKTITTLLKKYNVDNISKLESIKNKKLKTCLLNYDEAYLKLIPKYNFESIIFFDMLSKKLNINIQHALNGGEKKFKKYWVDGFIEEYNIVLEWDEPEHKSNKKYDTDRQKWIEETFGCKFIRIEQKEYFKNKKIVIKNITKNIFIS
jgi:transposase-like protein